MNRTSLIIGIVIFSLGLISGFGWLVSVPVLRYASLTSVLRSRLVSCEKSEGTHIFEGSPRQRCYNKELVSMVRSYGIASTITALRSYMKTPQGAYLQGMRCHAMAHEIGNAAAQSGIPSDVLMNQCTGLCDLGRGSNPIEGIDLGCMNGAGHTWVLMSVDIQEAFAKCAVPSIPESIQKGCYHGIGHGLRERYGVDMRQAISECLLLPNKEARYQCAHAIFMEPMTTQTAVVATVDLVTYCQELPTDVGASCFEFIGFMQYTNTHSTHEALSLCDSAPTSLQHGCRSRVGEAIYTTRDEIKDILYCHDANVEYATDCVAGFIRTVIDDVNDVQGNRALSSCALLPMLGQLDCYRVVGETLFSRFGEGVRQRACSMISALPHRDACMKSNPS